MRHRLVNKDAERVMYNGGEFVPDLMGNTTPNQRGNFSTPRQFYPADLFVGKEMVTVPAGTFEAFKIDAQGFNLEVGAYPERNIWVAPGVNADIAYAIKGRLRNGFLEQNDRRELVSYAQARSQ